MKLSARILSILVALIAVSCGSSKITHKTTGFGGDWSAVNVGIQVVNSDSESVKKPGDSSRSSRQQQHNLVQIKKDLKYITSKESIGKLKSEFQETIEDSAPYDASVQKATTRKYLSNANVMVGLSLGFVGLLTLLVFPIFGFTALLLGALFAIVGFYNVRYPNQPEE